MLQEHILDGGDDAPVVLPQVQTQKDPIPTVEKLVYVPPNPPIEKKKKHKCKNPECKRKVDENIDFCNDHQPLPPPTEEQIKSGSLALYSLHLSIYMFSEMMTDMLDTKVKLEGITNELIAQKDEVSEIYRNVIEHYGIENVEQFCSPLLALTTVSAGHIIKAVKKNREKKSSDGSHLKYEKPMPSQPISIPSATQ